MSENQNRGKKWIRVFRKKLNQLQIETQKPTIGGSKTPSWILIIRQYAVSNGKLYNLEDEV